MIRGVRFAMAAIMAAGGLAASGAAQADPHHARHWEHYRSRGHDDGAVIAAGVAGLILGAALASSGHEHRSYAYADGRYGPPPGYRYGYGPPPPPSRCRTITDWDPYSDRYQQRTVCW